jgi:Acyl-CoA carboxylase epsilon subunit
VTRPASDDRPAGSPVLRVVRGDATPEEIAALVAVLMSRPGSEGAAPAPVPRARSAWADRTRQLRRPLSPGPGAWRRSALPC